MKTGAETHVEKTSAGSLTQYTRSSCVLLTVPTSPASRVLKVPGCTRKSQAAAMARRVCVCVCLVCAVDTPQASLPGGF